MNRNDFAVMSHSVSFSNASSWSDVVMQCVWAFARNAGMSFHEALQQGLSVETAFIQSKAYDYHQQEIKNKQELEKMKFLQGNNIIDALNALIKSRR